MNKGLFAAAAVLVALSATAAMAEGPRPSSENNWAGMQYVQPAQAAPAAPHYVWQEGYVHGGKWRSGWVLVP